MSIEQLVASVEPRLAKLENDLASPEVLSDPKLMAEKAREHRRLSEIIHIRDSLSNFRKELDEHRELAHDADQEMAELAAVEIPALEQHVAATELKLKRLLVPEEPEDARNAVVEIRAGTGGEEAALFGSDLFEMYKLYFENKRWSVKILSSSYSDLGGIKELVLSVCGEGVYGQLKYESGVHRVQRVPSTEASGRLHTSAATVAVLPEAEEIDIEIDQNDLRIDTFRSSGPGGQHVNKTESAIRITHIPTGLVVSCQDEKSQLKNKIQAMKVLRARLFQLAIDEENSKRAAKRRSQVSTGDRSAKIRTYNYPQNRVTDHRVPITIYRLEEIMHGEMDLLLDPLIEYFSEERLADMVKELV